MMLTAIVAAVSAGATAVAREPDITTMRFLAPGTMARAPAEPASKPYSAVAITMPENSPDEGLRTFRRELAAVARTRIYGELERRVAAQGFFWERDFGGGYNERLTAADNLAAALRLEHDKGTGWTALARFAADETVSPLTGRPGIVCGPAEPAFDSVAFDQVVDATRSTARDWAATRAPKTVVRSLSQTDAPAIDTLGASLVRVLAYLAKDKEPNSRRAAWARVATPAGRIGFVAPGALLALDGERLCYGKDAFGRWWIAGFVGRGD